MYRPTSVLCCVENGQRDECQTHQTHQRLSCGQRIHSQRKQPSAGSLHGRFQSGLPVFAVSSGAGKYKLEERNNMFDNFFSDTKFLTLNLHSYLEV